MPNRHSSRLSTRFSNERSATWPLPAQSESGRRDPDQFRAHQNQKPSQSRSRISEITFFRNIGRYFLDRDSISSLNSTLRPPLELTREVRCPLRFSVSMIRCPAYTSEKFFWNHSDTKCLPPIAAQPGCDFWNKKTWMQSFSTIACRWRGRRQRDSQPELGIAHCASLGLHFGSPGELATGR